MVKARRLSLLLALALLPASALYAKDLGDYQLGDKADEDIVATAKLNFVDVDGTQAARDKEAQREPIILRYFPNAAEDVEAQFHRAFANTHEQFLQSINKSFGHRTLSADEIDSFKFQSLAMLFQ